MYGTSFKIKMPVVLCWRSISWRCDDNNFQIALRAFLFWIPQENKPRGRKGRTLHLKRLLGTIDYTLWLVSSWMCLVNAGVDALKTPCACFKPQRSWLVGSPRCSLQRALRLTCPAICNLLLQASCFKKKTYASAFIEICAHRVFNILQNSLFTNTFLFFFKL